MVFQKKKCILLRQTLGDIMNWEDILKISNRRAREIAYEYARADYDAGSEKNAERLSKPVLEEIDKFSDIIREYMADTTGKAKEDFEDTLDVLRRSKRNVFRDGKYLLNTSADVERFRKGFIPFKKFLIRSGIPASEFSWFK